MQAKTDDRAKAQKRRDAAYLYADHRDARLMARLGRHPERRALIAAWVLAQAIYSEECANG